MPGSDGLRILEFEKKTVSWDSTLEEGSWFSGARRGRTSSLQRGAARGSVRWKSQHRKKLCLSLLMSKNLKLRKVIKSFVPELKKRVVSVSCFSDSYMRMNIMNVLCMWISWSYFWTWVCYTGHSWGGVLTPLQRRSQCILQPLPTGKTPRWKFT